METASSDSTKRRADFQKASSHLTGGEFTMPNGERNIERSDDSKTIFDERGVISLKASSLFILI